jgi:hypothetical protein
LVSAGKRKELDAREVDLGTGYGIKCRQQNLKKKKKAIGERKKIEKEEEEERRKKL